MTLSRERAAAFVGRRAWLAAVLGVLVWGTWIGSIALGGSRFGGDLQWNAGDPAFHVEGTFGPPNWGFDVLGQMFTVDHLAFYSPARMIREGRAGDIYDHEALFNYQVALFPPGVWRQFEAYRNPPFYALLYYPTAGLPYRASAWVWAAVSLACLFAGVYWLGPARPWRAALWALTFLPVFSAVSYGQNSLLSFAALCGTYRLLAARQPFAAGLVAGLLSFKPPLLLGLIIWGLLDIRRLWPAALGVITTGAALTLGSYLLIPEAWTGFVGTLQKNMGYDDFDWWKMHNPRAFWRLLFGPGAPTLVLWLLSAALGVWGFVRVWRVRRDDLAALFGASVLLMLWVSPHTMVYEWALAVVPAVLWWAHLPRLRPAWLVLFAVAWVAMFVSTDFCRIQLWFEHHVLGWNDENAILVQVSVPVVAWVGWRVVRLLSGGSCGLFADSATLPAGARLDPIASAPDNSR
jgi:hypothetical protein